jgi:signal transduction histidine kinase
LDSLRHRFEPLYQHLATIKDGTERITTIVQDLRVFSQLDAAAKKTVVITDCLQSTLNLVRTKNNDIAHFLTEFKATPELLCYPAQLNQVFMNLIVNACDAIRVKMGRQKRSIPGHIVIGCQLINDHNSGLIEITIKDDGIGMDEQTKNKLFEPFYTTKDVGEGTGLGLSISYGIVQKHNGELRVESELDKGTLIRLTLPID